MNLKFRLTPTPSGYLHIGNALNFVLNFWQARFHGASLLLRIDDHDEARTRPEYIEDIFRTLDWLGIEWDEGPQSVEDFNKNFSQIKKKDYYFSQLKTIPNTFRCGCSRADLNEFNGVYQGTCYELNLSGSDHAVRFKTQNYQDISPELKDAILWRRDNLPSYQLVSVIEDRDQKITHVIRGEDLRASTNFQKALASACSWNFPKSFHHHQLLMNNGQKISKSQKASPVREEFSDPKSFFRGVVSPYLSKDMIIESFSEMPMKSIFSDN
ncbi:MAG: hypothetical protein K9K67_07025 [Bacteriovoracaceae bacterium]|nr:hypothetical protein [Bacteriovoracaceae bacterium]